MTCNIYIYILHESLMLRLHNIYIYIYYRPNDHGYNFMWYERIPNGTKQQSKMTSADFIAADKNKCWFEAMQLKQLLRVNGDIRDTL